MSEVWRIAEKTRRVLQAAAVEAYGRPGMYGLRDRIMSRANIFDLAEVLLIEQSTSSGRGG